MKQPTIPADGDVTRAIRKTIDEMLTLLPWRYAWNEEDPEGLQRNGERPSDLCGVDIDGRLGALADSVKRLAESRRR